MTVSFFMLVIKSQNKTKGLCYTKQNIKMEVCMSIKRQKRYAEVSSECVACGSCIKACKKQAISVPKGIIAVVEKEKCVGCGLCEKACPASVISMSTITQSIQKSEELLQQEGEIA